MLLVVALLLAVTVAVAVVTHGATHGGGHGAAHAVTSAPAVSGGEPRPARIPLLFEAVGYVGTILVVAGIAAEIGQRWDRITVGGRFAILSVTALVFLGAGLLARMSGEPALQRLTSVTWAASVAAFAGTAAVLNQWYDTAPRTAFVTIATSSTAYAALLWVLRRRAIQHAVLFAGVLVSTASTIVFAVHHPASWMIAVPLWAIGVAWAAAGRWRALSPWFVALPLGALVALVVPASIVSPSGLRFALGIGTAATVMALCVMAEFPPGLGLASVVLLGYVVAALSYYFGDTLGVPASLSIAGVLMLALAVVALRWHWFRWAQPPSTLPSPNHDTGRPSTRHRHAA